MNLLVTAGNTLTLIDKVRALTNIFSGRTGAAIALEGHRRGHHVTLLTSHPERVGELGGDSLDPARWQLFVYRTFEDLQGLLAQHIPAADLQAIVHCAAVSDYRCAGVFAPDEGTRFDSGANRWHGNPAQMLDRLAGKVKSDEPEIWLRLTRTPKLIDLIRTDWGFRGVLVKFKLEVGVTDQQLLDVAERSRRDSAADLMVANTLEGAADYAYLGPPYVKVARADLPARLLDALEGR